jgi:hypothetical protein
MRYSVYPATLQGDPGLQRPDDLPPKLHVPRPQSMQ